MSGIWYFTGSCVAAEDQEFPQQAHLESVQRVKADDRLSEERRRERRVHRRRRHELGRYHRARSDEDEVHRLRHRAMRNEPRARPAKCIGKAFLYVFLANASRVTVTFQAFPSDASRLRGAIPGHEEVRSYPDGLDNANGKSIPAGWILPGANAKPQGNRYRSRIRQKGASASARTFTVIGYTCQ